MTDVEGENPGAPLTRDSSCSVEMQASDMDSSNPQKKAPVNGEKIDSAHGDPSSHDSGAPLALWQLIKLPSVPMLTWLPKYDASTQLRDDLITGITLGVMLIPQGLAYASLAGLPPVYGLYASLMPLVGYTFFGTSKHLHFGPFALISLLVSQSLVEVDLNSDACNCDTSNTTSIQDLSLCQSLLSKNPDKVCDLPQNCITMECDHYTSGATIMSFWTGLTHVVLGAVRGDVISSILADPVMTGFTSAAAFIIMASQAAKIFGLPKDSVPRGTPFYKTVYNICKSLGDTNWQTFVLAIFSLVLLDVLGRANRKYRKAPKIPIPTQLVGVIIGICLVLLLDLDKHGVAIVGTIPAGLHGMPAVPDIGSHLALKLVVPSILVAFISFIINTAIAKIFSQRFAYPIDLNQELFATGLSNMLGSFFLAYPSSGSLSRGAVIAAVGEDRVSLLHNFVCAMVILLTLLCLTPLFTNLPKAVLAAIIIMAVKKLVNFSEGRRLYKARLWWDFASYVVAFLLTLVLGVSLGIVVAILFSMMGLIYATARPATAVLGRLENTNIYADTARYAAARSEPGLLIFRFGAALHFANSEYFLNSILSAEAAASQRDGQRVTIILLDFTSIQDIDATATKVFAQLVKELAARNPVTNIRLCCVNHSVTAKLLGDENLTKQLKPHIPSGFDVSNFFFSTTDDAVMACKRELVHAGQTFEAGGNSAHASAPTTVFSERAPMSSEVQHTESINARREFDPELGLRQRRNPALLEEAAARIALGGGSFLEADD